MPDDLERLGDAVGPDRRTFVKGLIATSAFAVPIVSSFTMAGVGAVFGGVAGSTTRMSNTTAAPNGFNSGTIMTIGNASFGFDRSQVDGAVGVSVRVIAAPNTVLPVDNTVRVFRANQSALEGNLDPSYEYLYAVAVAWNGPDAFPPGLSLTLTNPLFEEGDEIFMLIDGDLTPHSGIVVDGQVTLTFREDPGFIIARPPAALPTPPGAAPDAATAIDGSPSFTG